MFVLSEQSPSPWSITNQVSNILARFSSRSTFCTITTSASKAVTKFFQVCGSQNSNLIWRQLTVDFYCSQAFLIITWIVEINKPANSILSHWGRAIGWIIVFDMSFPTSLSILLDLMWPHFMALMLGGSHLVSNPCSANLRLWFVRLKLMSQWGLKFQAQFIF